jgi:hypothetical protein
MSEAENEHSNIEEFLRWMNKYPPLIPDTVAMHVLAEPGMAISDRAVQPTLNVACYMSSRTTLVSEERGSKAESEEMDGSRGFRPEKGT